MGVNLLYLRPGKVGGSEIYVRNLVRQLTARSDVELTLFCSRESAPTFADAGCTVVDAASGNYAHVQRLRDENLGLKRHLAAGEFDVLWSPANFAAPLLSSRVPQVVTVHDLQHHWLPEHFSRATRLQRTGLFAASFLRAKSVIAISDFTRDDVLRRYKLPRSRVVTVLEGVREHIPGNAKSATATAKRYGLERPFFFYPAADHAHKNHRRLVEAFAEFCERTDHDADLVLCGSANKVWKAAYQRASAYGVTDRVRHLGFVEHRDEVFDLMRAATALVFPSEFEGFGLPPVEAQRVGTPVIASDRGSIPEVVGDGALLLDAMDTEAWARAMARILDQPALREDLAEKGRRNVARFSWERCAAQTYDVLANAAS